jgi:tetratricopeptide (TPR) repeat protein
MNDNFETFKVFNERWKTSIPMFEKILIASQSDTLNDKGAHAYDDDDFQNAIIYLEQAIAIMPNNDDALKNLKLCYQEIGDNEKLQLVIRKLNYLGI